MQAENPAEKILNLLTSSVYRKGSLQRMGVPQLRRQMLGMLHKSIERGAPVQLTLMAFPFKVPNPAKLGERTLPDLAEFLAILRFCDLRADIKAIYPPGLELHILHDGTFLADVFEVEREEVRRYEAYFQRLIRAAGAADFIRCHDFEEVQRSRGFRPSAILGDLRAEGLSWWHAARNTSDWRNCFRKTVGMINLRGLSPQLAASVLQEAEKGVLPDAYRDVEERVHKAMVEYWVKDKIIHRFDPRPICFPNAIHATTHERPGRLALWLVRRGRSLLPWHGVGMLDARGRGCVTFASCVMSRSDIRPIFAPNEDTPLFYLEDKRKIDVTCMIPQ